MRLYVRTGYKIRRYWRLPKVSKTLENLRYNYTFIRQNSVLDDVPTFRHITLDTNETKNILRVGMRKQIHNN